MPPRLPPCQDGQVPGGRGDGSSCAGREWTRQFPQRHVGPDSAQPLSPGPARVPEKGQHVSTQNTDVTVAAASRGTARSGASHASLSGKAEPGGSPARGQRSLARSAAGGSGMRSLKEPTREERRSTYGTCSGRQSRSCGRRVGRGAAVAVTQVCTCGRGQPHTRRFPVWTVPQSLRCPSEGAGEGYGPLPGTCDDPQSGAAGGQGSRSRDRLHLKTGVARGGRGSSRPAPTSTGSADTVRTSGQKAAVLRPHSSRAVRLGQNASSRLSRPDSRPRSVLAQRNASRARERTACCS